MAALALGMRKAGWSWGAPLCDRLGVPFDRVRLLQGDSDQLIAGGGTGGSKSMMASGAAIVEASEICIEQGRQAAKQAAADVLRVY